MAKNLDINSPEYDGDHCDECGARLGNSPDCSNPACPDNHGSELDDDETELERLDDEPWDGFRSDAEADADVLASAGHGTDEDYGYYGGDDDSGFLDSNDGDNGPGDD